MGRPYLLCIGVIMVYIVVRIKYISAKKVIGKGLMILECLGLIIPGVCVLPYPGWIFWV